MEEQPQPDMTLVSGNEEAVLDPQQFPLKKEPMDLGRVARIRSKILVQKKMNEDQQKKMNEDQVADDEKDWNEAVDSIHEKDAGTFTYVIMGLPSNVQQVLMVASCLGSLDIRLLQAATSTNAEEITQCLASATEKGVIKETEGVHVFTTDNSKKNAYHAILLQERCRFRATIGRNLVRNLSEDELEKHIYVVLLQFHHGSEGITHEKERMAIASLCLRAVQWAMSASDFHSACHYSELGVLFLGTNSWRAEYDLSLAVYNSFAEVLYCIADFEKLDSIVSQVLENTRSFRDTLLIRSTRVYSLTSRCRMKEALEEGIDVLCHLGEKFPARPRKFHVMIEFMRTQRVLVGNSNEKILRTPLMEDGDKVAAMQMLNLMISTAYHTNPLMVVLIVTRMVQLTVHFGLSAVSTVGFAAYSTVVCMLSKNKNQGIEYGQLALALLEKFQAREWLPRAYAFVYGETQTYKSHITKLFHHLHEAHQVGLETGDIEFAVVASNLHLGFMISSGQSLLRCEQEAMGYLETAVTQKQETGLLLLRPALQFVQNLTGKSENPLILIGDFFREGDLTRAEELHDEVSVCVVHLLKLILAYTFSNFETAAREAEDMEPILFASFIHPGFSSILTYYSVALVTVAGNHHGYARKRLVAKARKSLKMLKSFSKYVPESCLDKIYMVEAELAAVTGNYMSARDKYMITIALSAQFGDLMLRSIACERVATFLRDRADESGSNHYFREAHSAYTSWGANAKVEQLEKDMPELFCTPNE